MRFAEHLLAHLTPEWRTQYIQYEDMKKMLYSVIEKSPPSGDTPQQQGDTHLQRYFATFDEQFFSVCERQLKKINTFFSEKLAEAQRKHDNLLGELSAHLESLSGGQSHAWEAPIDSRASSASAPFSGFVPRTATRKFRDLKLAYSEFYLSLILLQNYQKLNFMGFRKVLKKHDKLLKCDLGTKWRQENVELAVFYTNNDIDKLINNTEDLVTNKLEDGNRQRAMKRLRVPPLGDQNSPWTTFKVGLFLGAFFVLLAAILLSGVFHFAPDYAHAHSDNQQLYIAILLFRGPFHIVLFAFLLALNVYGWRTSGVNHVLIFELNPRSNLSAQALMEISAAFAVIWSLSVLAYIYSTDLNLPDSVFPLLLVLLMLGYLLNPVRCLQYEARTWLIRQLVRIACAPFFHVTFADFWLADQINSLVSVLKDVHFMVCFYASVGFSTDFNEIDYTKITCTAALYPSLIVCACFPAWVRFAQCLRRYRDTREAFPHLVNAGKYASTFFVVGTSAAFFSTYRPTSGEGVSNNVLFYLLVASYLLNSVYTYMWDILMDWGLLDNRSVVGGVSVVIGRGEEGLRGGGVANDYCLLRDELIYTVPVYYLALLEDFVLRFVWVISLICYIQFPHFYIYLNLALPSFEIFRRFIWNFFRLENEHLNNCGKFRAVRDISVAPIHLSGELQIIQTMDADYDVTSRRSRQAAVRRRTVAVCETSPLLTSASSNSLDDSPEGSTFTGQDCVQQNFVERRFRTLLRAISLTAACNV